MRDRNARHTCVTDLAWHPGVGPRVCAWGLACVRGSSRGVSRDTPTWQVTWQIPFVHFIIIIIIYLFSCPSCFEDGCRFLVLLCFEGLRWRPFFSTCFDQKVFSKIMKKVKVVSSVINLVDRPPSSSCAEWLNRAFTSLIKTLLVTWLVPVPLGWCHGFPVPLGWCHGSRIVKTKDIERQQYLNCAHYFL